MHRLTRHKLIEAIIRDVLFENTGKEVLNLHNLTSFKQGDSIQFKDGRIFTFKVVSIRPNVDQSVVRGVITDSDGNEEQDIFTFEDLLKYKPVAYGETISKIKRKEKPARTGVIKEPPVNTKLVHVPYTRTELEEVDVGIILTDPDRTITLKVIDRDNGKIEAQTYKDGRKVGEPKYYTFAWLAKYKFGTFHEPDEIEDQPEDLSDEENLPFGKTPNIYEAVIDQFTEGQVYINLQRVEPGRRSGVKEVAEMGERIIDSLLKINEAYDTVDIDFMPTLEAKGDDILFAVQRSFTPAEALGALIKGIFEASAVYSGLKRKITNTVNDIIKTSQAPYLALLQYLTGSKLSVKGLSASFKKAEKFQKGDEFDNTLAKIYDRPYSAEKPARRKIDY